MTPAAMIASADCTFEQASCSILVHLHFCKTCYHQATSMQILDRHVLHRDLNCSMLSPRRTSDASMRCSG